MFNDHSQKTGFGRHDPERMAFTWVQIAQAQQIDPSWDYAQAIDLSHLP